jgi:hypothetical protein
MSGIYISTYSVKRSVLPQAGGQIYRGMFKAFLDKQGEVASRFVSSRQSGRAATEQVMNYAYAAMVSLCADELMHSIHDQAQSLISKADDLAGYAWRFLQLAHHDGSMARSSWRVDQK